MKFSYSILYSTVSAVAITLVISGLGTREARAQACSPTAGQDISTMGGINSGTISCEAIVNGGDPNNFPSAGDTLVAPVINGLANQPSFTNSGTIENTADYNSPLFSTFPSSFSSSKGIGTFENSGTIGNSTKKSGNGLLLSSYYPELNLSAVPQGDFFTVLQAGNAIPSTAFISVLNNTSTGQIVALESNALYLHAGAKVTTLNNYGGIKSLGNELDGIAVVSSTDFYSEIGVLNNFSGAIISGGNNGILLNDRGSISELNNSGSIYGAKGYAIKLQASSDKISYIEDLNNTGSIYTLNTGADGSAIFVQGKITKLLLNSGRIYNAAQGYGIHIDNSRTTDAKINTLTNMGEISGGKFGIYNDRGGLETLNNAQGGNASTPATTALTYSGKLPTNYNVIINSPISYGQLSYIQNPSFIGTKETAKFGISTDSKKITQSKYENVLIGFAGTDLNGYDSTVGYLVGNYGRYQWRLTPDVNDATIWDLIFLGPNPTETARALLSNRDAVRSILSLRSNAMTTMMDYDCATFARNNFCMSFQARYSNFDSMNDGAGVLTAAYRLGQNVRLGAFIDLRVTDKDPVGVKTGDDKPAFGGFIGYSQNDNGTGLQAKVTAAYNKGGVSITRALFGEEGDTEAGAGKSSIRSFGLAGEVGFGFALSTSLVATPYIGVRRVEAVRKAYAEGVIEGEVEFPVAYDAFSQITTSGIIGLRLNGMLSEKIGFRVAAGIEHDFVRKGSAYSGVSEIPDLVTFAFEHGGSSNRTRAFGTVGLHYQVDQNHRLTGSVSVRQTPFSSSAALTTLFGYQGAF